MNEETKQFLAECKKAGYEFVTIYVADKRVPITMQIEKYGDRKYSRFPSSGDYWGETWREDKDGKKIITNTCRVVAAAPERRDSGRPAIWGICENLPIMTGCGFGESHNVRPGRLDKGCYDLKQYPLRAQETK